jgi:hypothetical protein
MAQRTRILEGQTECISWRLEHGMSLWKSIKIAFGNTFLVINKPRGIEISRL